MELRDLTNKYKNTTLNIALVILAVIVSTSIYKKQNKALELLKQQKVAEQNKNELLEDIARLEKKINSYKNTFIEKDSDLIMVNFSTLSRECGINIVTIRPGLEQRSDEYVKFSYDFVIKAPDFHSFGKFIAKLENSRDIYLFENVSLQYDESAKELNIRLKLSYIALN